MAYRSAKGRFCSERCRDQHFAGENSHFWRGGVYKQIRICQMCGKSFEIRSEKVKNGKGKFCSRQCVLDFHHSNIKKKPPSSTSGIKNKSFIKKLVPKDRPGFVYLLHADNGLYKIGRAKAIDGRIKDLGLVLPYDLELVWFKESKDMYFLEAELHRQFKDKRLRGEWFELTEADIIFIKIFPGI